MAEGGIRAHVVKLLGGTDAHLDFDDTISRFPADLRTVIPEGAAHSAWQLLEHLRIAQWDILEFSRDPKHVSPKCPEVYWPDRDAPPDEGAWQKSVTSFAADLQAMADLVADPSTDLYARIPHGSGQTILREALLVADHNAYHLGQLVLLRRLLGVWIEGKHSI
ncbi:MAG: DinB family protein [Acidobacteria bacterium]|nr:DinB family protein [Acidobacteriota bacterium]